MPQQTLEEWTANLDQHWAMIQDWFKNSNPMACRQVIDLLNEEDEESVNLFVELINHDRTRAKLIKNFARLAVYEAMYRLRVRMESEPNSE